MGNSIIVFINLHKSNYMFSNGQITFAIIFAIVFIGVLIYAYRKDTKLHKRYYTGVVWILIAFISFIALIAAIKFIFMR